MRRITHTFVKIALTVLCVVYVFGIPESQNSYSHGGSIFAISYVAAQSTDASRPSEVGVTVKTTPISWTDTAFWTSGAFLIYITGMLLGFAGWALNGSIHYFVIDMGTTLGTKTPLGQSILTSWGIIRDIINLTFVFGMIYLAFMTIVKADTGKLKHGVVQLVIAALLINFSLFFAKAIIDFGNVAAVEIYTYMQAVGDPGGANQGDWASVGISGFFMKQLGLTDFFNPGTVISSGGNPSLAVGRETGFGFSLLVSLTLLVATFVFFAGAILIAIRFITLALLLILSPVAFAGAALPGINTEEWSSRWWKALVSNVLFAPAYFLLLFVSMKAVNVTQMVQGISGNTSGTIVGFFKGQGDTGSIAAFMNFVLVIGFLVGSLIISKRMGAYGADSATKWGAQASFGLTAALGRNTIGRFGNFRAESENLKDRASQKGVRGFIARRELSLARSAQKGSFDARGLGAVQSLAKNHDVNLKLGDAQKGGYAGTLEDVANKEKTYAASLGTVDDKDPRVLMFKKQQEDAEHHQHDAEDELKRQKAKLKKAKDDFDRGVGDQALVDAAQQAVANQEDAVKTAKKASEAAKETVEHEKNRRILGNAVSKPEVDELILNNVQFGNAKAMLEQRRGALKNAIRGAAQATTKPERENRLAEIKSLQKDIKGKEEEYEQAITKEFRGNAVGYAGVLDTYTAEFKKSDFGLSGAYAVGTSLMAGRTRSMSGAGAKAVRDTKKAVKKAEKKDDRAPAGGGDGHGGHH